MIINAILAFLIVLFIFIYFTLQDDDHPVKVGLSDAYIIDRTVYCKFLQIDKKYLLNIEI